MKSFDLNDDDEHLLGFVPEYHDLFQVLHHAYTYGVNQCYYLIYSHASLLYVLHINFRQSLLLSYSVVTDWLYGQLYKQFYVPGNEVPAMSSEIKEAIKDPRFEHLKMSEHTFQCYLGLWRAININPPKYLHYPLPPLARIIPLTVATCNTLKAAEIR